ncbi:putative secondary metabolism biosynthetic enzyme [Onygenales sp. PD_40]|nr:putative secondary metabolism biosynthetic enzyme [Onygenales sp. PD_40]KAK2783241.1 putative secondary metabolism biosynthetic enzyme [Onygenales sp. PD_12]KAK2804558.1 putative secondary metabolism biosynthetic enzyme [Onygenales sp. PD_10]
MAQSLAFNDAASDPIESIQLVNVPLPPCGPKQVLVRLLSAPVNPLDIAVIQGKYPVKPQNSITSELGETLKIPGSDGAARVTQVGDAVTNISVGDIVILKRHCRGSFRTHAAFEQDDVLKVPDDIDVRLASILRMGVAPAYFQLTDYHPLVPGDWVIQTAATGTIPHFVCQFAQFFGVNIISVIRRRSQDDDPESVKRSLKTFGASLVLTEDELDTTTELDGKRICLAIDSVSNETLTTKLLSKLAPGSTYLTVGFLGRTLGPAAHGSQSSNPLPDFGFIAWQRNITLKGFRLTISLEKRTPEQQTALLSWFSDLVCRGLLKLPALEYVRWNPLEEGLEAKLRSAISQTQRPQLGQKKKIFVFDE